MAIQLHRLDGDGGLAQATVPTPDDDMARPETRSPRNGRVLLRIAHATPGSPRLFLGRDVATPGAPHELPNRFAVMGASSNSHTARLSATAAANGSALARILLLMSTHTYKAEAFLGAAARLGVDAVAASEQAAALTHLNPAGNLALGFDAPDLALREVRRFVSSHPVDAVLAADDDGTLLAATLGAALGLRHNPVEAVRSSSAKLSSRLALRAAGLPVPRFWSAALEEPARDLAARVEYPCVIKPRHLSASRGVMRADDPVAFVEAHARLVAILDAAAAPSGAPHVRPEHAILVERFVPGVEVALEGVMCDGHLQTLALFDKPDPLDGPFFEETLYITPSRHTRRLQRDVVRATRDAIRALGLRDGPIHAELRVNERGAWLLEAAPRSIGGLCSRVLRFGDGSVSLEHVLIRNALGEPTRSFRRRPGASGVMMIPIPRAGILASVTGVEAAAAVAGVAEIRITAAPGSYVAPPPEGARYLGFIFARAESAADVEKALRASHARLHVRIEPQTAPKGVAAFAASARPQRARRRTTDARESDQ